MPDINCIIGGVVSDAGTVGGTTAYTVEVTICTSLGHPIGAPLVTTTGYLGYWAVSTGLPPTQLAEAGKAIIEYKNAAGAVIKRDCIPLKFDRMAVLRQTLALLRSAFGRLGRMDLLGALGRMWNIRSDKFYGVAGWAGTFNPGSGQIEK